jgi:hypothetical protein
MDIITYAKNNKFKLKPIPPSNVIMSYPTHTLLKFSRDKTREPIVINEQIPFNPISTYCDADSSRIRYLSPYNEFKIIEFIDSQKNLVDKILCLNPKQIGIVNPNIEILFDYNNQLHYLISKYSIINIFNSEFDPNDQDRYPIGENKILFFDENNKNYLGYGDLNLNNILFATLLHRFNLSGFELQTLPVNENLNLLHELTDVRSIPYKTDYSKEDDIIVSESPFNFSNDLSIYNENLIIDRTSPLWESFKVTIQKTLHYSDLGNDISYLNPNTNLSMMDEILKKIYSWKSCVMVLEKENTQWNSTNTEKPRYTYDFLLIVGIKTRNYKITEKIESLFYITAGNNYIDNGRFSKKDIFFIKSSLKRILNLYKPDKVHFFDLSNSDYGNICKNGLLFGMDSPLQDYIIDMINKKDNKFVKTTSKIENLYELFEQL